MTALDQIKLKHAVLNGLRGHLKNYLECMSRAYYGKQSPIEEEMCKTLEMGLDMANQVCKTYYSQEEDLS